MFGSEEKPSEITRNNSLSHETNLSESSRLEKKK